MDLETLRKQPHLSASSIQEYIDCSLSYKFAKIDKIQPEYIASSLILGNCVHRALEAYHKAKRNGLHMKLETLLKHFETEWNSELKRNDSIQFKEGETESNVKQKGLDILNTYYQKLPPDSFNVLKTEYAFSLQLDGIPVPIIDAIDLIEEDESGSIIVTDFKTSSRAYSKDDIGKSLQLTLYYMAAKEIGLRDREILLRFDCLIKTKIPKFEQYYTIRTEEDINRTIKKIHHVWNGIQNQVFIPNDTSWKCGYCCFKQHCDRWFQE